jgi:hypothetical protein
MEIQASRQVPGFFSVRKRVLGSCFLPVGASRVGRAMPDVVCSSFVAERPAETPAATNLSS